MKLKEIIKGAFRTLGNSQSTFKNLKKKSLESVLEEFIKLVLFSGLLSAVASFSFILGRGFFFDVFRGVTVEYLRLANYAFSLASGTLFFYMFAGTFGVAFLAILIWIFARTKFFDVVKIVCVSFTPVLVFGWLSPKIAAVFLLWSFYLLVLGFKNR